MKNTIDECYGDKSSSIELKSQTLGWGKENQNK